MECELDIEGVRDETDGTDVGRADIEGGRAEGRKGIVEGGGDCLQPGCQGLVNGRRFEVERGCASTAGGRQKKCGGGRATKPMEGSSS